MNVNLKKMPSAPKEYTYDFPMLNGGLNTDDLPYRLKADESPDMVNMWWDDGVLQSRPGANLLASLLNELPDTPRFNELETASLHVHGLRHTTDDTWVNTAPETQAATRLTVFGLKMNGVVYQPILWGESTPTGDVVVPFEAPVDMMGLRIGFGNVYVTFKSKDTIKRGRKYWLKLNVLNNHPEVAGGFEMRVVGLSCVPFDSIMGSFVITAHNRFYPVKNILSAQNSRVMFLHVGQEILIYEAGDPGWFHRPYRSVGYIGYDKGTFFEYGENLYYKNRGHFLRIYDEMGSSAGDLVHWIVEDVTDKAFSPIIQINTTPLGAGDLYQSENRLSPKKRVQYNTDGSATEYMLPYEVEDPGTIDEVFLDGVKQIEGTSYDLVHFSRYDEGELVSGVKGIAFRTAPAAGDNNLEIEFTAYNSAAYDALMSCKYAITSGGSGNMCTVLGGCESQPNAVFWNANDQLSMNDAYWPVENYNLLGDTNEAVTGFGKQYSDTVAFKKNSLHKLNFDTVTISGRTSISFTATMVNPTVGCDVPGSIQTVENNLVFLNTRLGVYMIRSTSSAYENNVACISNKIKPTLRDILQQHNDLSHGDYDLITSFDDGSRYILCVGGKGSETGDIDGYGNDSLVWDYSISSFTEPSWFHFTNTPFLAFVRGDGMGDLRDVYAVHDNGVYTFEGTRDQFAGRQPLPIKKVYSSPVLNLGTYKYLKDVTDLIIVTRGDFTTTASIVYDTDYEQRTDKTNIVNDGTGKYAKVSHRKPMCRHIKHFTFRVEDEGLDTRLGVVSAQLNYHIEGEDR